MRGHVVRALGAVAVELLALGPLLGGDAVEGVRHVGAHVVVPVLVEAERARRVLHEQVEQADLVVLDLGQRVPDVVGHQVRAARPRREGELLLRPGHDVGGRRRRGGGGLGRRWRGRWEDECPGQEYEVVEESGEEAYEEDDEQ